MRATTPDSSSCFRMPFWGKGAGGVETPTHKDPPARLPRARITGVHYYSQLFLNIFERVAFLPSSPL